MTVKAFIFDMDGTIIDNMRLHRRLWLQTLEKYGAYTDEESFSRTTTGRTNPEILRMYLGATLTGERIHKIGMEKEALYREIYRPHLQALAGLNPFFEKVHKLGIPIALATAAPAVNVDFILDGLEIRKYFHAILDAEAVRNGKPHPEIFLNAAQKLDVHPQGCLVFEDSLAGIEAARRAGMRVIALTTSHPAEDLLKYGHVICAVPDYTALDPEALLAA